MKTIEFETTVVDGVIYIPDAYSEIHNASVTVTVTDKNIERRAETDDKVGYSLPDRRGLALDFSKKQPHNLDFSELEVDCFKDINPIEYQRRIRDGK